MSEGQIQEFVAVADATADGRPSTKGPRHEAGASFGDTRRTMLNPDDFKRTIQAIERLGAKPDVLVKVSDLAKDLTVDLASLCALLRRDGPLAADIIRISNSPYYAPTTLHSNLTSAVNYIGMREVFRAVHLCLSRRIFARDLPSYGISAADYWSASVAAALMMEALAKQSGLNPEDAYTIGILHAIGRILINHVIEERRVAVKWDGRQPVQEWERSAVGLDYAQAGAMLLEHWSFPILTCDVIRCQLDAGKAAQEVSLFGSLKFTLRLLALTGLNFEKSGWRLPEADPFMQASGLTPVAVLQCISTCRQDFGRIVQAG
jgi:HD-like signal output (HDOD) protein